MKQKKLEKQQQQLKQDEAIEPDIAQEEEEEDDLLTFKGKHIASTTKLIPTLSKRQLRKIKPEGHFEGRNKIIFDDEGKPMTEAEQTKRAF